MTLGRAVLPVLGGAARSGGRRAEQGRRMRRRCTDGGHGSVAAQRPARAVTGARAAAAQTEGEVLSRRNGELEATLRRARAGARDADAERERLAARLAALEASLARERERAAASAAAAAAQARHPCRAAGVAAAPALATWARAGRQCSRGSGDVSVATRAYHRHGCGARPATACRGRAQVEAAEANAEAARREAAAAAAAARREAADAAAAARAAAERGDSAALAAALEREAAAAAGLADLRAEFQARDGRALPGRAGRPVPCSL